MASYSFQCHGAMVMLKMLSSGTVNNLHFERGKRVFVAPSLAKNWAKSAQDHTPSDKSTRRLRSALDATVVCYFCHSSAWTSNFGLWIVQHLERICSGSAYVEGLVFDSAAMLFFCLLLGRHSPPETSGCTCLPWTPWS